MSWQSLEEEPRGIEPFDVDGNSSSEEALRASEEKYRTLFEAVDEGLAIAEVILDDAGEGVDYRILEANARFEHLTGMSREEFLSGKTVRELIPSAGNAWARTLGRVAVRGESVRFESHSKPMDRWFEVYVFRVGDPSLRRVALLYNEITTRLRAEQALRSGEKIQAYLLKLSDVLRPIADPIEIMSAAPEVLARELCVSVAGYVEMSADGDNIVVGGQYADGRMPELKGPCRFSEFGDGFAPALAAGEEIFISDVFVDPRGPAGGSEKTRSFKMRSVAGIPLIKDGRLVAFFYATHFETRMWESWEREIFRQTAERTWAAVERARAESAQRESEEKYRALFSLIDQGFAVIEVLYDESGAPHNLRFTETNPAFEKLTGLANPVGKTSRELIPNLEDSCIEAYAGVVETGESTRFESYSHDFDRWLDVFASRVGGEGSHLVNVVFDDITERKQSEAALRESEERQAYLLKLSDALRPLRDPIEIQGTASRLLGEHLHTDRAFYSKTDEERGQLVVDRDYVREGAPSLAGRYPLEAWAWIEKSTQKGQPTVICNVRTSPLIPDADRVVILGTRVSAFICVPMLKDDRKVSALCVADMEPRGWTEIEVALVHDTADRTWAAVERAKAEVALRESEERFRLFLENVHEYAFVQLDPELRMTSWNPGAERIFGYSSQEALGRPFSLLLSAEDREIGVQCMAISNLEKAGRSEDARWLVRKDGQRIWTRWVSEPIHDENGRISGLTKVLRDETERLKAETSLRQSEKLAVVGRMASSIAHEINNPLEAAMNLIYLARNCVVSSEAAVFLQQAEHELARVSHIATATLHFHRQTPEPAEVDVEEILESILLLHEGRLRATQVATDRRYGLHPTISCLANEIRQVFANLVGNAIDAMSKNSEQRRLIIRIRKAVDPRSGQEGVRVMIADTGSGIRESARKHVFEPFFTTKTATGTGLGLWISAETVKKHQGTLRFRSRTSGLHRGTVFSVFLGICNNYA